MNTIYCLVFITFFYGICSYAMLCDDGVKRIKELRVHFTSGTKAMLGIVLLASLLLVGYWAQQDRFVYYWDYSLSP